MYVRRLSGDAGFTLIEVLISAALMIAITALTCSVLQRARTAIEVTTQRGDLHQRARVGLGALASAIADAGAGSDSGPIVAAFGRWAPPLWSGARNRSLDQTALTLIRGLPSVPSALLAADAPAGSTTLSFEHAGCSLPCGFVDRMTVAVVDGRGDFDLFLLDETDGASAAVRRLDGGTDASYLRGAAVLPVDVRTFYWNAAGRELRSDAGDRADFPIVNDVVGLWFEYFGDPDPPQEPRPPAGDENCLYDSAGGLRPELQSLSAAGATLTPLEERLFADGPWCGSGAEPFDADLLRIRVVRVRLRVQAASPSNRGNHSAWFSNPGFATDPALLVKDLTLQTTVAPRNLAGWR
jgi:type II secretory pathway pseudopilin PulG